ncbi:MAG: hypothetical protein ABLT11_03105, partial [Candidatus Acidiferrum sp.]
GGGAALAVYGELLGEICGTVGISHGSSGEEQEFAEVALVERETGDFRVRETLATGGLRSGLRGGLIDYHNMKLLTLRGELQGSGEGGARLKNDWCGSRPVLSQRGDDKLVAARGDVWKEKFAVGGSGRGVLAIP